MSGLINKTPWTLEADKMSLKGECLVEPRRATLVSRGLA